MFFCPVEDITGKVCKTNYKSGAEFTLRHRFVIDFSFAILLLLSSPLSRLAPIEALPISCERSLTRNLLRQGFALYPQGVSPLDPDQGRAPGPFARFARWVLLLCVGV